MKIYVISSDGSLLDRFTSVLAGIEQYQLVGISDSMELLSHPSHAPDAIVFDTSNAESMIAEARHLTARFPDVPLLVIAEDEDTHISELADNIGLLACLPRAADRRRILQVFRAASMVRSLHLKITRLQEAAGPEMMLSQIVARSGPMHTVMHLVDKACKNEINVLLEGEEGTGKALIARVIHHSGWRSSGPFLMLNCVAIPNHLIEYELFGYEAEVFEGELESKAGIFELAEGGTVHIDEIGELPLTAQARLYRTMQTRQVRRLGSEEDIAVNVRIISSTSRDLREMYTAGKFREELYFRLASFPLRLPALRERVVDIPPLAEYYLKKHAEYEGRPGLGLSRDVFQLFRKYSWPGNVRELENCIQRAVRIAEGVEIVPENLPLNILIATGAIEMKESLVGAKNGASHPVPTMDQLKSPVIRLALEASGGNVKEAARRLDIGRTTIYKLIAKYNIEV